MTELETQLLKIIEEQQQQLQQQQTQLQQQQQSLDVMQKKIIQALSAQSGNGERTDRLSANTKVIIDNTDTISRIGKNTATYTEQINGKVREMSQITTNYEDVLEKISTTQRSVSSQVAKAQQNLLETSELLKRISSK